jgi:hemerythrin
MASRPDEGSIEKVREDILQEHRELMALIEELGQSAARGSDSREHWSADVAGVLTRLRTVLFQHFANEEEGPFANELPVSCPQLAGGFEEVLAQHTGLMERVDQLLRKVSEAAESATSEEVLQIRKEARDFIEAIRAHEAAENALLQRALHEDLGGSG